MFLSDSLSRLHIKAQDIHSGIPLHFLNHLNTGCTASQWGHIYHIYEHLGYMLCKQSITTSANDYRA